MNAIAVLAVLCMAASCRADDCLTKLNTLQASIDLLNREHLESQINGRVNQHFDELAGFCGGGTPAKSMPLGAVPGMPVGVSGPARCALYCQDYDGCISFNFLSTPAVDGSQCQLFTAAPTQCTTVSDKSCRHFQIAGRTGSCMSTSGYTFLPVSKTYYKPIYESLSWANALKRCQADNPLAHLAMPRSMTEFNELTALLRTVSVSQINACSTSGGFGTDWAGWWTANRKMSDTAINYYQCKASPRIWAYDVDRNNVRAEAGWEDGMFLGGMPDCSQYWRKAFDFEMCNTIAVNHDYKANDMMCDYQMCALCQLDVQ